MKNEIKDNLIDYFFAGKAGFSIVRIRQVNLIGK